MQLADGRTFGVFAAFFRIINAKDEATGAPEYAHSYTWALSDVTTGVYVGESRVDPRSPQLGLERIANGRGAKDERLNRAMIEILERGQVPSPDRMFDGAIEVATDRLFVQYGSSSFEKLPDGNYRVRIVHHEEHTACDLVFAPRKQPIRHGDDGIVRGNAGEQMFYYFIPRCEVTGTITVAGETLPVATGQGWYDHEFGGYVAEEVAQQGAQGEGAGIRDLGWNWTAIQLDDGTDLTAYEIVDVSSKETVGNWMISVGPDSSRLSITDVKFVPGRNWVSHRTFNDYPTTWRLTAPSAGIDLAIEADFADQEIITVISKPAFWEGRCTVRGTAFGREVRGVAYIERSGFANIDSLDEFFGAVGEEVRRATAVTLPLEPTHEELRDLIATEELDHYMEGVHRPSMAETLIRPIREMIDRGGKSWRSYAALACCDVVGGDSRKFSQWLPMPELLHVGSLIIDDVQDKSTVRRGGPSCHVTYGEAVAINSGTAAYFLCQNQLRDADLDDQQRLRVYDLYFAAMRAGHAGQAIDLGGMASLMPRVVETGDSRELCARILACHRLKTAAPAGCLARMGAVAGRGTDEQVAAVGEFFEAVGLAFQIMDDVLNLKGFKGDLKQRGEDIANGTVTLPIAVAMSRLPKDRREHLWKTLQSKPSDLATIAATIELVQTCGAIQACADQARELVEAGWRKAEPLLEPSLSRVMLRAFGWYVLERHY